MKISELIRTYRKKAGMTQRALAQRLGLNQSAVGQWETGLTEPSVKNMLDVKLILGIPDKILPSATAPYSGEIVENLDELALLRFWRSLDDDQKRFMTRLLRIDIMK